MSKFSQSQKWQWLKEGKIPDWAIAESPTLHFCLDWDALVVEDGDPEYESCFCIEDEKKT